MWVKETKIEDSPSPHHLYNNVLFHARTVFNRRHPCVLCFTYASRIERVHCSVYIYIYIAIINLDPSDNNNW